MSVGRKVIFWSLPIQVACPVLVSPEGVTLRDGELIPLDERTEYCAVLAHWMIGAQVSCDVHTLIFCEINGVDFDELVREIGRDVAQARLPWSERKRGTQEEARAPKETTR